MPRLSSNTRAKAVRVNCEMPRPGIYTSVKACPPLVRVTGFEPATPCSQSTYATKLRYTRIEKSGKKPLGLFMIDIDDLNGYQAVKQIARTFGSIPATNRS